MPRTEQATANLLKRVKELEERLEAAEARIASLEARTYPGPVPAARPIMQPQMTPPITDCGCPMNHTCMNTACPRMVRVTFSGVPDGVGFPD